VPGSTSSVCVRVLKRALEGLEKPRVFHSDQVCQYASKGFTGVLKGHGIAVSMLGWGRAYDNIFVECFWRSLKHEEIYKKEYRTVSDLRRAVAAYIHHLQHRKARSGPWLHGSVGGPRPGA
jgi:putative transposase